MAPLVAFRVALCFWGLVRSLEYTLPSIECNIFDPLQRANISYTTFIHTYRFAGNYTNPRTGVSNLPLDFTQYQNLQPHFATVEDQDRFDASINLTEYSLHKGGAAYDDKTLLNHLRALNSQNGVTKLLLSTGEHYDAVVYLRSDVRYLTSLEPSMLRSIQPGVVYTPHFHSWGGVNDRFGIGDMRSMAIYGSRWQSAKIYAQKRHMHAEQFLKHHLLVSNLTIKRCPILFFRVRANGHVNSADEGLLMQLA